MKSNMELEKKGGKWSISSWDGSKFGSNGKDKGSNLLRFLFLLSFIAGSAGFWLVGYGFFKQSKSICVVGFVSLFIAVILFIVVEIIREAKRVNKNYKFVKNKWKKDDFFDN